MIQLSVWINIITEKCKSTKFRKPLELIYYEAYLNSNDALGREKFLKSGSGHRYLTKQLKNYIAGLNEE